MSLMTAKAELARGKAMEWQVLLAEAQEQVDHWLAEAAAEEDAVRRLRLALEERAELAGAVASLSPVMTEVDEVADAVGALAPVRAAEPRTAEEAAPAAARGSIAVWEPGREVEVLPEMYRKTTELGPIRGCQVACI
ncbi:hypothetical protein [Streptomyces sp. H27-H5]|nr:hypothetical protein [Streptomyces sp. H27-H5]MCY0963550.1 hypothetical protein [Streptomyces sp. H27-H5]